jgi:cellulose synthase/poly-beta-1,6-N-acetylglucosamine synthase-like glycosyltransferase
MTALCLWVVGATVAFGVYTYLAYPLLLLLLAVLRRARRPIAPLAEWPTISIVLPAYNEEAVLRDTLENLLQLDYPADRRQILVLSDASTDHTDAIVSQYAGRGVQLLRMPVRGGKTAAENAARPLLRGEIIVNTDASVQVERGALKRLITSFADPTVGVASSHNVSVARVRGHANYAESWYVRYDMWVRDLESRVSGIVGAAGCLYAVRASVHLQFVPDALSRDFAAGLMARELGLRAVSVRDAVCFVPRIPSLRREYRRKVRTITRGIETLYYKRRLLNPFRYGLFSWILGSHKLCRWLIPHSGALTLVALAGLAGSATWARWAFALAAFTGVCAALAFWWPEPWRLPKVLAVPAYFVIGNLAALQASIRAARGLRTPVWEPTRRQAQRLGASCAATTEATVR